MDRLAFLHSKRSQGRQEQLKTLLLDQSSHRKDFEDFAIRVGGDLKGGCIDTAANDDQIPDADLLGNPALLRGLAALGRTLQGPEPAPTNFGQTLAGMGAQPDGRSLRAVCFR